VPPLSTYTNTNILICHKHRKQTPQLGRNLLHLQHRKTKKISMYNVTLRCARVTIVTVESQ